MHKLYCRYINWGWTPNDQLFFAFWPVVVFCKDLHLFLREDFNEGWETCFSVDRRIGMKNAYRDLNGLVIRR